MGADASWVEGHGRLERHGACSARTRSGGRCRRCPAYPIGPPFAARVVFALIALLGLAGGSPAWAAEPPILGKPGLMGQYGSGWGTVAPRSFYNGGVPSGMVNDITWRGWGRPTATGRGRKPTYRPRGGYFRRQVATRLRASRLARCPGGPDRPTYTRLIVSHRVRPGGRWSDWFPWTLDLCDFDAKPDACGAVSSTPGTEDGAFRITAWDTGCRTARKLARAARRVRLRPGRGATGMARYRMRWRGFRCSGYSFSSDDLPRISWTCYRRTAQVTFERS